jgi:hypothetical protein
MTKRQFVRRQNWQMPQFFRKEKIGKGGCPEKKEKKGELKL